MKLTETVLMEIRVEFEDGHVDLDPVRAATIAEARRIAENSEGWLDHGDVVSTRFIRYIPEERI